MFGLFEPERRFEVLEHFYRLPEPIIERFYAAELSPRIAPGSFWAHRPAAYLSSEHWACRSALDGAKAMNPRQRRARRSARGGVASRSHAIEYRARSVVGHAPIIADALEPEAHECSRHGLDGLTTSSVRCSRAPGSSCLRPGKAFRARLVETSFALAGGDPTATAARHSKPSSSCTGAR